ncbi:pupal cuticle protein Edg-78E [Stomoxys calcitrans]|uniref:pupal cuticle protein Edg-78E n=1 Tax=Stomoxys calcitrans TaxID=35570 RepID=UPI0027E2B5BF|nr:pupal cuticle protein Edg-78E [Stomoxys calcitrans]
MIKFLFALTFIALVAAMDDDAHAHVEKAFKQDDGHGHFAFGFDVTNGIGASEKGDEKEVTGEYHYVTKDGHVMKVTYTADKDGFHPHSDLLPVAPPIPEAILKGLEYIRTHPHKDADNSHKDGHKN